ncbi:MAG: 3-hydroxyacyl-CoA dehydrogenase NAD-binding domain-containing protein [Acidimicrobiaceae bacterium]|nr:3-hydroxyacyl-CoA dehydrogenase NAD-binding domain-containing protein [Acidimicrobiaceae bacterium]
MTLADPASAADFDLPARVGVVGAGVIGAAWAARWALVGVDVTVADPSPTARSGVERTLEAACAAWRRLGLLGAGRPSPRVGEGAATAANESTAAHHPGRAECASGGALGRVTLADPAAGCGPAVRGADLILECVPERLEVKHAAFAEIEAAAAPDAVIASSTSGFVPSELQAPMAHPERLLVGHPFNPVYLLPLVEIVGGARTSEGVIAQAMSWFAAAGMSPVRIGTEIEGFVADRLLEALWREALWLVHDGVATTGEIDEVMRLGFGLRWAQMGVFQTYATAGGEGGLGRFIEHFAPALQLPWTKLTDVPELTPEFTAALIAQVDGQSAGQSVAELCAARDRNLVDLLLALEANDWGAGCSVAALRRRFTSRG